MNICVKIIATAETDVITPIAEEEKSSPPFSIGAAIQTGNS